MSITDDTYDKFNEIIDFVNEKEIFWVSDLYSKYDNSLVGRFIKKCIKRKLIQCSEYKKQKRQYIVISKISITDLI